MFNPLLVPDPVRSERRSHQCLGGPDCADLADHDSARVPLVMLAISYARLTGFVDHLCDPADHEVANPCPQMTPTI
jgi:hypothetical protein